MGRLERSACWQQFFKQGLRIANNKHRSVAADLGCTRSAELSSVFLFWGISHIRGPPTPFRLDTSRRKGERQ